MNDFYADLHIHIGRTASGKPVKITGSKNLTVTNILQYASAQKGLQLIGVIDCQAPEVIEELEALIHKEEVVEHPNGGLIYKDVTLLLGSEIEIYDSNCSGAIHVLCYFPTLAIMKEFSAFLQTNMKNITLSTQRIYISATLLQEKVAELGGIFIPAHIFTPFKSLYGKGVKRSLTEVFNPNGIDAMELGLSADTTMADYISELHDYTFLSNSDAHSLNKMAREYQTIRMKEASFLEFQKALKNQNNRGITANYGLNPLLGKYHETVCANCLEAFPSDGNRCISCGHSKKIMGVSKRIQQLADSHHSERKRPPYIHQIPLEFIPGLGKKTLEKLVHYFRTEMNIIHKVPYENLLDVVAKPIANYIIKARAGTIEVSVGGGGKFGKINE